MRLSIPLALTLGACTKPAPPLSVAYEVNNLTCETTRKVTIESAPGSVVQLSYNKTVEVGASGRAVVLLKEEENVGYRATATLEGHEEAKTRVERTRLGFARKKGRHPEVSYAGVRVWIEGTDLRRKGARGVEVRFQGKELTGRDPIDAVAALSNADLTALQEDAPCPYIRLDGLEIKSDRSEAKGSLWVTADGAHRLLEKALAQLKVGKVIEAAPTGNIGAELRYHRVEFHGGLPKRLSDIRWVGDLFYEQKKVGTCGMYEDMSTGRRVRIDRYRGDLLAKVFERHTGKVVAKKRHRGRAGRCSSVQLGSSPSVGKSKDKKARTWLKKRLAKLAS